ncbi:MAG: M14 family zinc carboxypeptidase [Pseudobdellovibrionaceae bacterium]
MNQTFVFGKSALNLPIAAYRFSNGGATPSAKVLILGGVHGDEIEGVIAAHGLLESFLQNFPFRLDLVLVPAFNIDGVLHRTRTNSRGVDLNRNLPTKDWSPVIKTPRYHPGTAANSEPENQALSRFIETEKPNFILSLHSWHPVLNVNGDCLKEAEVLSRWTGYKIDSDIGYPTPGCLGTYAGIERNSPTLTYEIERGLAAEPILRIHVPAILEALKETEKRGGQ